MSLERWQASGWLSAHRPSGREIADLLAIADRDIEDCQREGLSADWKFAIAYNSVLQAATAALAAAGYRAGRESHHYRVLQSLSMTIGLPSDQIQHLDAFRKKRNVSGYERIGGVSDQEVREIIETAIDIRSHVGRWMAASHPELLQ